MRLVRVLWFAAFAATAPIAAAQNGNGAPAANGHPDFQGLWTTTYITPLERPPEAGSLVLTAAEADVLLDILWRQRDARDPLGPLESVDVRRMLRVRGEIRSSLIVDPPDGRLPLTDAARARRKPPPPSFTTMDDPEQRPPTERCLPKGGMVAPMLVYAAGNFRQIVQTPEHLVIESEAFLQTRIIPLQDKIAGFSEMGRGHWDGETLVVETSGFAENDRVRAGPYVNFSISPKTTITERFTYISKTEILYAFTVEDPSLYTRPWTAEMSLQRSDERLYEWACHEGNYAMPNMLRGARLSEQRAKH